jgi:dihydropteroate synthase
MPAEQRPEVVVRLRTPYPDLSTLSGESELSLRVEGAAEPEGLAVALAEFRPELGAGPKGDSLALSGRIGSLSRALSTVPPEQQEWPSVVALQKALERFRGPAPALRLGHRVWRFGERTYLLGVVNATPDSFSGDGVGRSPEAAAERARQLVGEGADAIDVGGESTRPGHQPVSAAEEIDRVVPALALIRREISVPVFVDTSKADVARAALDSGADGINDIWGLRRDPEMAGVVARARVPVVCMHNRTNHEYRDLMGELQAELRSSLRIAEEAGIPRELVVLDPGIGFGKVPEQSYEVLRRLCELRVLGCPVLVGTSRKSLIGWLLDERPVEGRLLGTAATVAWSVANGADIVRVHDVGQIRDIVRVMDELSRRFPF